MDSARIAISLVAGLAGCEFSGSPADGREDGGFADARFAEVDASEPDGPAGLAKCHQRYDDLEIGNNKYEIVGNATGLTYEMARAACQSDGGRLIVFDKNNEFPEIRNYLRNNNVASAECPDGGDTPCAWIGLSQQPGESDPRDGWVWSDGTSHTPDGNWRPAEPNDGGLGSGENGVEDCADFVAEGDPTDGWNDKECATALPAVCECHSL